VQVEKIQRSGHYQARRKLTTKKQMNERNQTMQDRVGRRDSGGAAAVVTPGRSGTQRQYRR
jgi:hypothetical protein